MTKKFQTNIVMNDLYATRLYRSNTSNVIWIIQCNVNL